jgi:hypothetical protein
MRALAVARFDRSFAGRRLRRHARRTRSRVWAVTPVYDVLHTWPYESDHRIHPAVSNSSHDRKHWGAVA